MNIKKYRKSHYMMLSIMLICAALLYAQVIVENGFNTEVMALDGYRIKLRPESRQDFGGLSWGFIRFDLEDRLDVGVTANIGANRDVIIRLEKDGHTLVATCQSDQSGTCYGVFRRGDMKMSGDFRLAVQDGKPGEEIYRGRFFRKSRPMFLLREFILSV